MPPLEYNSMDSHFIEKKIVEIEFVKRKKEKLTPCLLKVGTEENKNNLKYQMIRIDTIKRNLLSSSVRYELLKQCKS